MRCFFGINLNGYGEEFNKINLPRNFEMSKAKEYHITLIFYKDLSEEIINKLRLKFNTFSFPEFKIEGNKIIAFPNKSNPELYSLGFKDISTLNELHDLIIKTVEFETKEIFSPHITLLRKEKLSPNFKESKENYSKIKPIKIKVNSFGLYKSEPDKGMNSYSPIFIIDLRKKLGS
jgi:2'-5' RNA ligase